jgi:flagellar assembly protein FliH
VAVVAATNMSSRIIRGDDRFKKLKVSTSMPGGDGLLPHGHPAHVEKQAFEQGYQEGERIGKQMGEKMVETVVRRYDKSLLEIAEAHKNLVEQMEEHTVRMAIEISRKVIQRELTVDPDLVSALAAVALKRVQGHQSITLRVSRQDFERVNKAITNLNPAIAVKDDANMDRGDFVVDTAQTHLDGRVSSEVEALGRLMLDE